MEALTTLSMRCMCEGDEEKRKRRQGATALFEPSPIYFSFLPHLHASTASTAPSLAQ
jgi:hypothetical protein